MFQYNIIEPDDYDQVMHPCMHDSILILYHLQCMIVHKVYKMLHACVCMN